VNTLRGLLVTSLEAAQQDGPTLGEYLRRSRVHRRRTCRRPHRGRGAARVMTILDAMHGTGAVRPVVRQSDTLGPLGSLPGGSLWRSRPDRRQRPPRLPTHRAARACRCKPAREGWVIVGRRGGKSRIAALVALYLACFRQYRDVLAPGEIGTLR